MKRIILTAIVLLSFTHAYCQTPRVFIWKQKTRGDTLTLKFDFEKECTLKIIKHGKVTLKRRFKGVKFYEFITLDMKNVRVLRNEEEMRIYFLKKEDEKEEIDGFEDIPLNMI